MTKHLVLASLLVPSLAAAGPEVGVIAGAHAFSDSTELGARDGDMALPGPDTGGLFGARGAMPFGTRLAVEGELTAVNTKDDVLGDAVRVYGIAAHARFDLLTGKIRPFVVAGLGLQMLRTSSSQMANDTDQAWHWGLGGRYAISDALDVRLDVRHLIVPDRAHNGATSDVEITAGLTWKLGAKKRPAPREIVVDVPMSPPPEPPPPATIVPLVIEKHEVLEELAGIAFDVDSARLTPDSRPILQRALRLLTEHPTVVVEISGHTSSEGEPAKNLELSRARADAVKAWLVAMGVEPARIIAVGHGNDQPLATNVTEDGRRANRRIEFRILVQPN